MKKIINKPEDFVNETLSGILKAYPDQLRAVSDDLRAVVRKNAPIKGKVAIATGGGSGHLPLFLGYVGKGLADGAAVGNVFSSPTPEQILAVTNSIDGSVGVLYLYGNYQGDILNFDSAAEMAELEEINVETVLVTDDVASAPPEKWESRRGVAGLFFAYKIAGACADEMNDLNTVARVTRKAVENIRSMGVALSPCSLPEAGRPTFEINDDEMELGMGIHGEKGVKRDKLLTADEITEILVKEIINDLPFKNGDDVAILVNSFGATPREELYIMYRKAWEILNDAGIKIYKKYIGEYTTSLEMAGASITLFKLDAELKKYLDAPAKSPFFIQ
jgi:phosphoenolpyruvate---glycerone phosphotransferase subunit DhaK